MQHANVERGSVCLIFTGFRDVCTVLESPTILKDLFDGSQPSGRQGVGILLRIDDDGGEAPCCPRMAMLLE